MLSFVTLKKHIFSKTDAMLFQCHVAYNCKSTWNSNILWMQMNEWKWDVYENSLKIPNNGLCESDFEVFCESRRNFVGFCV